MEKSTYIPLEEFIADLTSSNYFKDNPQLVDEASIARWVFLKLKNFGRNVMDKYERVIHIDNFRAELPENFASLSLAVFCEPHLISMPEDTEPLRVQSRLYAEKISCPEDRICTDCLPTCKAGSCSDRVVENLYLDPTTNVNVLYRNPVYVKLGKDLIRSQCEANCINRHVKDSPYSINIKGKTVYSNFKKGSVYIQYYGLPVDENCLPVIPITPNGYLEEYLEYYVKRKILEDAMLSDDTTNKQYIYGSYMQQETDLHAKAKSDTSKIDMVALFRAMGNNRFRMHKYDVYLGALKTNYVDSGPAVGYGTFQNPNPFRF
jgi:hypothetical protein